MLRQPFGGMGKSCFGPGMKAGGPELRRPVHALLTACEQCGPASIAAARASIERAWREEFGTVHDHFRLLGQDNCRRYLPIANVRIRIHADDSELDVVVRVAAAAAAGCATVVSAPASLAQRARATLATAGLAAGTELVEESDDELAAAIRAGGIERLRCAAPDRVAPLLRAAAATNGTCICDAPVTAEGRVELLWYVREQSVSFDYHRYGNLGARASEDRAAVE